MARKGKRFTAALENLDRNALYTIEDAVKILKDNAKAKFDETIEVAMNPVSYTHLTLPTIYSV